MTDLQEEEQRSKPKRKGGKQTSLLINITASFPVHTWTPYIIYYSTFVRLDFHKEWHCLCYIYLYLLTVLYKYASITAN